MIMDDELYKLDCKFSMHGRHDITRFSFLNLTTQRIFFPEAFDERLPMPHDAANFFLELVAWPLPITRKENSGLPHGFVQSTALCENSPLRCSFTFSTLVPTAILTVLCQAWNVG